MPSFFFKKKSSQKGKVFQKESSRHSFWAT